MQKFFGCVLSFFFTPKVKFKELKLNFVKFKKFKLNLSIEVLSD